MTSTGSAITLTGGGVGQESLDIAAKALLQILGSQDPEESLLGAISDGTIPGEIGLELAEVFGEIIKVLNLDNAVETVTALSKSSRISTPTEEVLFLTVIAMAEQEEAEQAKAGNVPAEAVLATVPAALSELNPPAPKQASTVDLTALVGLATELLQEFGTIAAIPTQKLAEIRQVVEGLPKDKFDFLRQSLSSAILAQAELTEEVDVSQDLEVLGILFGKRQTELTAAVFSVYEALYSQEGFRLRDRDGRGRPLMTVTSIKLLRDRFRRLLDSLESSIAEGELAAAEKVVAKLEEFLLAVWQKSVRESDDWEDPRLVRTQNSIKSLQQEIATRLRERIISSGIRVQNAIASELVSALPQTKEEALTQVNGYLESALANLGLLIRGLGNKSLAEADGALEVILLGHAACIAWRSELGELEGSDYNPADQRPVLSANDQRLALFEVDRKELVSILEELDGLIKASQGAKTTLKKLAAMRAITVHKLEDLDTLIAPLRPRRPMEVTVNPSLASVPPPPRLIPPPPPLMASAAPAQEACYV